jgi:hypothetical protein
MRRRGSYTYNTPVRRAEPFFPVGVWHSGAVSPRDFQSIKAAGFNTVWMPPDDREAVDAQAAAAGLNTGVPLDRAGDLQVDPSATGADLRVWGWTALLRGAHAIAFNAWRDLVDEAGVLTPRGRAAGEFAGVISRNPALFAPLRPAIAQAPGVAFGVHVAEGGAEVEAGFLESRDVLVLIAVNHASAPQRATFAFAPGTKVEFWQNMETGEMVSFQPGRDSPAWTHAFAARDAVVVMIRKRSPYDR